MSRSKEILTSEKAFSGKIAPDDFVRQIDEVMVNAGLQAMGDQLPKVIVTNTDIVAFGPDGRNASTGKLVNIWKRTNDQTLQ